MDITIQIKGSASEIADLLMRQMRPMDAAVPSTSAPSITTIMEATMPEIISDVSEPVMEAPEIPQMIRAARTPEDVRNIRRMVLSRLAENPNLTNAELANLTNLNPQQTRTALKAFGQRNFILRKRADDDQKTVRYSVSAAGQRYLASNQERMPAMEASGEPLEVAPVPTESRHHVLDIKEFIMANPGSTIGEIRKATNIMTNTLSASLSKMKTSGELVVEGQGGNKDPFRYRISQMAEDESRSEAHPS